MGDSAEAAVLAASLDLSNAIRDRIVSGATIPLPSELKPGQIQIPVDADATARLDAHVARAKENQLRRLSEIEQANREKRASFLSEFRANLEPIERVRDQVDRAAIEYASIAIKSSYILNGGALVAIPAILQFAEKGAISKGLLLIAVILFVAGILLAAVTNYLAYRSMFRAGESHGEEVTARAVEVKNAYYPADDPSEDQAKVQDNRTKSAGYLEKASRLANCGVGTFSASILVFLVGVGVIIYGLGSNSGPSGESRLPAFQLELVQK